MPLYKKLMVENEDIGPTEAGEEELFYVNLKKQIPNIKSSITNLVKISNRFDNIKDGSDSLKVLQDILTQLENIKELCDIDKITLRK